MNVSECLVVVGEAVGVNLSAVAADIVTSTRGMNVERMNNVL